MKTFLYLRLVALLLSAKISPKVFAIHLLKYGQANAYFVPFQLTSKIYFCANLNCFSVDLDDYPFHAVTYGEPGELYGLPYNVLPSITYCFSM